MRKLMKRTFSLKKPGFPLLIGIAILLLNMSHAQETKWIRVGSLHNWYMESGCEPEVARRGLVADQQDGMRWPAQFRWQDSQAAKALWIGATNYNDIVAGVEYAHKVAHVGPRQWHDEDEFMPAEFTMIGRFDHPTVLVDGIPASDMVFDDVIEDVNPDQKADRILINKVRTSMGILMTRKIYAFSQQYNDNYFIYEFTFKNDGIVHIDGTTNPQDLTGVYFFWQYRYAVCREMGAYGLFVMPQSATWGHNTMNDVVGYDPAAGDPFRALFSWHGRHSGAGFDNIGAPNIDEDGRLLASQYIGVVTIHADASATDKSDDSVQPRTTYYQGSDMPFQSGNDQYNPAKMTDEYVNVIAAGDPALTHAAAVGDGFADQFGQTSGGFSQTHGYGPYDIPVGDSIRIVMAEGMNGLSRQMNIEVGGKWYREETPYNLPGGGTTNDVDEYKDAWIFTGRDSIFQTFNRAIANYQSGFDIPLPPPPPDLFEVNSGGDRIQLSWSDNAESWPGFAGYRVYRAINVPDTTYEEIFACGAGTGNPVVNSYDDTQAARGFDYYYYVISFDDGSTNNVQSGVPLRSSRFYTQTNEPANLKRQAGTSLDSIRVVPNPFNIRLARDPQLGYGDDRILFLDIPPLCKIKIFTERGDLIKEIDHTDGSGDEAWDQVTSSRQIVVSGIYIAYFEVTEDYDDPSTGERLFTKGENAIRKFVIIR